MTNVWNSHGRLILIPVFALGVVASLARAGRQETSSDSQTFLSGGKQIRLERFTKVDNARHPAVLVLYGGTGLTSRGDSLRHYARSLADHGYVTFLVQYLDATESPTAGDLPVSRAHFQLWTKAVEDAIGFVGRDAHVDAHRIGILGLSLGAFLGLWEASQDPRVKAISEYYGGTSMFLGSPKRMPATLIIHGEKDSFVRVEEAYKLKRLLEAEHAPYQIRIYAGQEHGFDGPEGDPAAALDAWNHTLAFFQEYLAHH